MDYILTKASETLDWLIGPECSEKLLHAKDYTNVPCLRLLLSKALSLGILVGGLVVKLPQILKVLVSGSAAGLSLISLWIETFAIAITVAYNLRKDHPFTTFGESLFILVPNALLIGLVLFLRFTFGKRHSALGTVFMVTWFVVFAGMSYFLKAMASMEALSDMQSWTIGLVIASKLPQILSNFQARSTGQLSALSTFLITAGSLARVYTTFQEVHDPKLMTTVSISAFLNVVILLQLFQYAGTSTKSSTLASSSSSLFARGTFSSPPSSSASASSSTPKRSKKD